MRLLAFVIALLAPVLAHAGNSKITKKDGSSIQVVTTGSGSSIEYFDKAGKKTNSSYDSEHRGASMHQALVKKLAPAGSKIEWGY